LGMGMGMGTRCRALVYIDLTCQSSDDCGGSGTKPKSLFTKLN
jgi:hypothetical protein